MPVLGRGEWDPYPRRPPRLLFLLALLALSLLRRGRAASEAGALTGEAHHVRRHHHQHHAKALKGTVPAEAEWLSHCVDVSALGGGSDA